MSSWSSVINEKLSDAIKNGELEMPEELVGKPIDLEAYFSTPHELRMGYSVLASSGFTPLAVDLMKEINHLKDLRRKEDNIDRQEKIDRQINQLEVQISLS